MSEHFVIRGSAGKRLLEGTIAVRGAKNAALKGIAASVLFRTPVTFTNVPEIEDVSRMLEILSAMGAKVRCHDRQATIDASALSESTITPEIAKRLRAAIVLTGPVLARFGQARFPHPGGCVIGERPIDLFIEGFEKMGARVKRVGKFYEMRARGGRLTGAEIFFRTQSVTGTETFMMAGVLAKGRTVIKNAAMEPEIAWLAELLNASGARVRGAGTPTIVVEGGRMLRAPKRPFHVIPDRIEAGSFLILGALAARKLLVRGIVPEHVEALLELLEYTGAAVKRGDTWVSVSAPQKEKPFRSVSVRTHEYPGFPTDLQAPFTVYLTQGKGESMMFETIFEGRLNFTESLNRMGANITMMDPHRVIVKGKTALNARTLESPDLRAGLAFVIAATIAQGVSEIHNVYNIDRGYERIEERLRAIGVDILRRA